MTRPQAQAQFDAEEASCPLGVDYDIPVPADWTLDSGQRVWTGVGEWLWGWRKWLKMLPSGHRADAI